MQRYVKMILVSICVKLHFMASPQSRIRYLANNYRFKSMIMFKNTIRCFFRQAPSGHMVSFSPCRKRPTNANTFTQIRLQGLRLNRHAGCRCEMGLWPSHGTETRTPGIRLQLPDYSYRTPPLFHHLWIIHFFLLLVTGFFPVCVRREWLVSATSSL